jgi:thioesterase domain-containing protein/NAD(P)-dependent dehydrogenase (short-subunit alcohol dehydrogenase family)/aryl carrier-like protein
LGKALGNQLSAAGHEVVYVTPGMRLDQIDLVNYQINPVSATDFETLVSELDSQDRFPQRIVHMWTLNEREKGETAVTAYHKNQQLGFYSLFYLAQALANEAVSDPLTIKVVTNGSQQVQQELVSSPEKATLTGPVKVIPQEMPNVQCQLIDVGLPSAVVQANGEKSSTADAFVTLLLAEIQAEAADDITAYRDGIRWQQTFAPAKVAPAGETVAKADGVYLITGGLGGIGLTMAENLARQAAVKLVLTSRSGLPPRAEWADWQQQYGPSHRKSLAMQKIAAIEASGSEIMVAAADITNQDEMTAVIHDMVQRYGRVNGVIHAAGVLDDGLIPLKSYGDTERVLNPKAKGALILDELLKDQPLDFFVLFSSTSSIAGLPGQIDYAAANAFLNAFAQAKQGGSTRAVAVDWGMWQEVGMAARAARGEADEDPDGQPMPHPLLDWLVVDTPDETEYITDYAVERFWLLDQHRIKNGSALIPGTGYLEIAKAAIDKGSPNGTTEISDLMFMMPLEVAETERKRVRVQLQKDGPGHSFTVASRLNGGQGEWVEHVRGMVQYSAVEPGPAQMIEAIKERCNGRQVSYGLMEQNTRQEQLFVDFGPRWKTLRQIWFGEGEALAYLEMPEQFRDDMKTFQLHPALMDLATSFALPLLDGYDDSEAFFVPFTYQQVRVYKPLPAKVYSHARLMTDGSRQTEMPVFDVCIMDETGQPVIEVAGFMQKRVAHETMLKSQQDGSKRTNEGSLLDLALTEGILPDEGAEAFNRLLAGTTLSQVVVSSLDLQGLIDHSGQNVTGGDEDGAGLKLERPSLQSDYEAPRNNVESALAEMWQDLLGVKEVGIHDDFFELGGHSLIAVRLFAKIKKMYHVDLSLATLFEAPTIAECAEIVVDELGEDVLETAVTASSNGQMPKRRKRGRWTPLVTIEKGKSGIRPFFCVHGAGGNVLNFRELSRYLGKDQPFYGLQAVGVDGQQEPLASVEDMAEVYLKAMLEAQPEGPYQLGGYSGGGVIALEMAQRLEAQGKPVDLVVFFDTFHPHTGMKKQTFQKRLQELRQRGIYYLTERIQAKISRDFDRLSNELKLRYYLSRGQSLPHELRDLKLTNNFLLAASQYQPQSYNGRVVLFSAEITAEVFMHAGVDRGWKDLLPNLDVCQVPGNHDTMVLEPNIQVMIHELRRALQGVN